MRTRRASAVAAPPPPTVYEFVGATLVVLETADRESWANGVNRHGEVVGGYMAFEDQKRPFFHNGTFLGIAGGTGTHDGEAFDINTSSEVVGGAEEAIENDALRAFFGSPVSPSNSRQRSIPARPDRLRLANVGARHQ